MWSTTRDTIYKRVFKYVGCLFVLTVYLLRRVRHRFPVRVQAVRVFRFDGHSTQDGIGHQLIIEDHVGYLDVPICEPIGDHVVIWIEFHRFLKLKRMGGC